jgi:hypothetical protein
MYSQVKRNRSYLVHSLRGYGPEVQLAQRIEAAKRQERRQRRDRRRAEQQAFRDAFSALRRLAAWCKTLTAAQLVAAGYRQHDRGHWRLRRDYR